MKRKIKSAARIEGSSQANSSYRWSEWMTIQEGDPSIDGLKYRHYTNPEYPEVYGEVIEYDESTYGAFVYDSDYEPDDCGQYTEYSKAIEAVESEISMHFDMKQDDEQYQHVSKMLIADGYIENSVDTPDGSMSYFHKDNLCIVIFNSSEQYVSNILKRLI